MGALVTTNKREGSTIKEAIRARNIITAVSCPYAANIGIGANPSIANPTILDAAEATKATPKKQRRQSISDVKAAELIGVDGPRALIRRCNLPLTLIQLLLARTNLHSPYLFNY